MLCLVSKQIKMREVLCMKRMVMLALALMLALSSVAMAAPGKLESIAKDGVLKVGTTGDYKPMSYLDKTTGKYAGFDTELAAKLADALGVQVQFVPTTWSNLTKDTMDKKFDVAICGITRTFARAKVMDMSQGYLKFGKTILVRKSDAAKFKSVADLNKKGVRVMVNPGGTNEKFAKDNLPEATLLVHQQNAEIPGLIAEGKADVMITETMEARRYVKDNKKLAAPLVEKPFTKNNFGVLMAKGDQDFLNFVNMFMQELEFNGTMDKLEDKYIK